MSKHHYDHIRGNKNFHELVARKSKLSWSLAALMMLVYYSFILVIAFFPEWLGTSLTVKSTMTWGLPVGIGLRDAQKLRRIITPLAVVSPAFKMGWP